MSSRKLCFSLSWALGIGLLGYQACQAATPKTAPKTAPKASAATAKVTPAAQKKSAPSQKTGTPAKVTRDPALTAAYNSYINALKSKIEKSWNYPDGKNHVVFSILVAADGSVSDMKMTSTPNSPTAEQAASDSFNQAQPLPALPATSPPCRLTITFDSAAAAHSDAKANFYIKLDALDSTVTPKTMPDTEAPPDVDMTKTNKHPEIGN